MDIGVGIIDARNKSSKHKTKTIIYTILIIFKQYPIDIWFFLKMYHIIMLEKGPNHFELILVEKLPLV